MGRVIRRLLTLSNRIPYRSPPFSHGGHPFRMCGNGAETRFPRVRLIAVTDFLGYTHHPCHPQVRDHLYAPGVVAVLVNTRIDGSCKEGGRSLLNYLGHRWEHLVILCAIFALVALYLAAVQDVACCLQQSRLWCVLALVGQVQELVHYGVHDFLGLLIRVLVRT